MDRNRSGSGHPSGREAEDSSHRDIETDIEADLKSKLIRLMGMLSLCALFVSAVTGFISYPLGRLGSIITCLIGGIVTLLLGMTIGIVGLQEKLSSVRLAVRGHLVKEEIRFQKILREAVANEKKECGGFAVEMAKAVSNRVADRLLARYASGLLTQEHREATIQETNEIVNEEMRAFQAAVGEESEE